MDIHNVAFATLNFSVHYIFTEKMFDLSDNIGNRVVCSDRYSDNFSPSIDTKVSGALAFALNFPHNKVLLIAPVSTRSGVLLFGKTPWPLFL